MLECLTIVCLTTLRKIQRGVLSPCFFLRSSLLTGTCTCSPSGSFALRLVPLPVSNLALLPTVPPQSARLAGPQPCHLPRLPTRTTGMFVGCRLCVLGGITPKGLYPHHRRVVKGRAVQDPGLGSAQGSKLGFFPFRMHEG